MFFHQMMGDTDTFFEVVITCRVCRTSGRTFVGLVLCYSREALLSKRWEHYHAGEVGWPGVHVYDHTLVPFVVRSLSVGSYEARNAFNGTHVWDLILCAETFAAQMLK